MFHPATEIQITKVSIDNKLTTGTKTDETLSTTPLNRSLIPLRLLNHTNHTGKYGIGSRSLHVQQKSATLVQRSGQNPIPGLFLHGLRLPADHTFIYIQSTFQNSPVHRYFFSPGRTLTVSPGRSIAIGTSFSSPSFPTSLAVLGCNPIKERIADVLCLASLPI